MATNALIHETSPYLLQHAHNPVNWMAWNPESLRQAKAENKLILVSIGYSTCHWCHVMERESFEDRDVADVMNEHFICIKVDREERPDVDAIYMEACQIMTGGGGWPLNCFLTPDGRPFYAGTYFPPMPAHNRPSWMQLLHHLARAWRERPEEVLRQADQLMGHLYRSDKPPVAPDAVLGDSSKAGQAYLALRERFDLHEGGFGGAPKFPGAMSISFLLQFHYFSGHREAAEHAFFSLDKMCRGGIYDHLGGGFARYATDVAWLIPHFEKMLYDNALLVSTLSDALAYLNSPGMADFADNATRRQLYAATIRETLEWVSREMTHPEGGFYSAQDADSEGVEGKFFVWEKQEVETALSAAGFLPDEIRHFCAFYDVTEKGNWEHRNILHRDRSEKAYSESVQIEEAVLTDLLARQRAALFAVRDRRIYPGLDDKILLSWSALMVSAFAQAAKALQNEAYKAQAERSVQFLMSAFFNTNIEDWAATAQHSWKNGKAAIPAFLEDYAYLIAALTDVWELSGDERRLHQAGTLTRWVIAQFYDEKDHLFFFTSAQQTDILLRKKELYDNATPSSNSTMARNLQRLSILLDQPEWAALAQRMLERMAPSAVKFPNAFGRWMEAVLQEETGISEIAVTGPEAIKRLNALQAHYLPATVAAAGANPEATLPLLAGKVSEKETLIYICRNFACQRPVETVSEALSLLVPAHSGE